MLQTNDFYCKLYSYLIGAPVIIDDKIYNYKPPNKLELDENIFKVITKESTINLSDFDNAEKGIIYKGLKDVKTNGISRQYFIKYYNN